MFGEKEKTIKLNQKKKEKNNKKEGKYKRNNNKIIIIQHTKWPTTKK